MDKNFEFVEQGYLNVCAKIKSQNEATSHFPNLANFVDEKLLEDIDVERSWGDVSNTKILKLQGNDWEFWEELEDVPADVKSLTQTFKNVLIDKLNSKCIAFLKKI